MASNLEGVSRIPARLVVLFFFYCVQGNARIPNRMYLSLIRRPQQISGAFWSWVINLHLLRAFWTEG